MGKPYKFQSNGNLNDSGLQIIRYPSSKFSLSWFDIRVFYVRISNFTVDGSTPEFLTLNHIPLSPDTVLEVNGARCSINSEGISCILKRDRVDRETEEATFVSTDSVRATGSVKFEVFDREDLVISGFLEGSNANGEPYSGAAVWSMNCESAICAGKGFLTGKQIMKPESLLPTIEVYVAGCFSGTPIILSKTMQIDHKKKKKKRNGKLHSIRECDLPESREDASSENDLQVAEYKNYESGTEEDFEELYWRRMEYTDGEDGELSFFNAGVRFGVGIGLSLCLGLGIGSGCDLTAGGAAFERSAAVRLPGRMFRHHPRGGVTDLFDYEEEQVKAAACMTIAVSIHLKSTQNACCIVRLIKKGLFGRS